MQAAKRPHERTQALWVILVATATKENPENKVQDFEKVIDDGEWEYSRKVLGVKSRLGIHYDVYDCACRQGGMSEQMQSLSFQKNAVLKLSFSSHTLFVIMHIILHAPCSLCETASYYGMTMYLLQPADTSMQFRLRFSKTVSERRSVLVPDCMSLRNKRLAS